MPFLKTIKSLFNPVPRILPGDAAEAVRSGSALLVDVREPGEWRSGVAEQAVLLPLSDLTRGRKMWKTFLETARNRYVLLYCASGGRSAIAARLLAGEGFRTANAGGLHEWAAAGWPVVAPAATGGDGETGRSRRPQ